MTSRLRVDGIVVGKPAAAPSNADRLSGRGARRKSSGLQASRVSRSEVVLADRFDCRSRRAARGQERPGVKSARKRPRSSHPLSGAGRRKSVGSRVTGGQALTPVAGSRSRVVVPKGAAGRCGHSSMEGVSGRSEPQPLTGRRGRRSWRRAARRKARSTSRQGASEVGAHSPPAEDNAAERGASLRGLADIGAHQGIRDARNRRIGGSVSGIRPKRVERRQARHGPACLMGFAPLDPPHRESGRRTGNRAIGAGARDVESVAEVGEEHPPRSRTRAPQGAHGPAG